MFFTKNEIIKGDGFYISYLPHSVSAVSMFSGDGGSPETALVNETAKHKFLILNGDFREEYRKVLAGGYDACVKVYEANKDKRSSFSDDSRDEIFA